MLPDVYCLHREFEPADTQTFRLDRHYLLYAMSGTLRLQADGKRWTLPPARAAFIPAAKEVEVSILTKMTSASVLFAAEFHRDFPERLAVFEITPLCRELIRECMLWGPETGELNEYAQLLFTTLASVVVRLSLQSSRCFLPIPKSEGLKEALNLTEANLTQGLSFKRISAECGQSPRSLARRFSEEMGMTWRDVVKRMRIIQAVEQLATTDASITEVSFDCGYNSLSAFNAAFRELMDQTPRKYRMSIR
ncbi:helix-turn-helix transcriptional regulator [Rhizobium leguminosarum]|uniref:helix-turn-helix transcriptional regulator n=1 Tax=Rhizobium leguminosarum TaxID=384 RepID=UPI00102F3F2A|nr:AraC family transcriptional regulator [Rhizobium leguminosarum]TAU82437.1 AraC family transcriptional regulator [Rhizobium leguminosarum]TAX54559.1 AraC family transcriptional regulator [Rhizobium leguminosarum]TAY00425.1 AraC family transcriptional regulator [Rhizobium leguminosarum]TAZ13205.1 AraC family transcriptional regulator [Rhizobium leguminosarum]